MAKKKDDWQPLLLDLGPAKKPAPAGERVEYDKGAAPRPPKPPPEPKKKEAHDHTPWWERVQQVEAARAEHPRDESWGRAWRGLLLGEGWTFGLRPARQEALEQAVRGVDVRAGVVEAGASNGRERPHRVQLRLPVLTQAEWARVARQVVDDGAEEILRRDLAAGIVPLALVDAADRHALPLVPRRGTQVSAACTCGGARLPCEHVLATHLALARRLDTEPLQLLAFRGGPVSELLALLERVRGDAALQQETREGPAGQGEPFAFADGPAPDLVALDLPSAPRAPFVGPDGWRAKESFDAVVKRLVGAALAEG